MVRVRGVTLLLLASISVATCTAVRTDTVSGTSGDGGASSAPSVVGGPCQSSTDCLPIFGTAACYTQQEAGASGVGAPGGYCTSTTCNTANPSMSCGANTICGGLGGAGDTFCEAACSSSSPCSAGYDCLAGGCVPGPPLPADAGTGPSSDGGNPGGSDGGNPSDGGAGGCPGGGTVTGIVHAPTPSNFGTADPIYNATVYIPGGTVADFTPGVVCGACGAPLSGSPVVQATTAADGSFTLSNTPVGMNVPLVIQIGRWRRQVVIPTVACGAQTAVSDDLTRLPRTHLEGDIPLIALATGSADPVECVLEKIGIDPSEFTYPGGVGRVQFYVDNGATLDGGTEAISSTLFASTTTLEQYDMVVLACPGAAETVTPANQNNLISYANVGGRVFATHYTYVWLATDAPFSTTATWDTDQAVPASPLAATIDQTSTGGTAFATWSQAVGATTTIGDYSITEARHDFNAVATSSTRWLYAATQPLSYTFDTPVGVTSGQCGRVQFSDFHVASAGATEGVFPSECSTVGLSPQEKALEFMLFDVESCVP